MEETLVYQFSSYSKFEFFHHRTASQGFVLVFVRKTTEFLIEKKNATVAYFRSINEFFPALLK